MRGDDLRTEGLFSYVSCEGRVPLDHPLRRILPLVDAALSDFWADFAALYAPIGRPSIPPEKLLRALPAGLLLDPLGPPVDGAAGL